MRAGKCFGARRNIVCTIAVTIGLMDADVSSVAALIGDPTRARILCALMGDLALPAGELAMIANVAPQTASAHLSKLLEGKLVNAEVEGRHHYYRLASPDVAATIEALAAIAPRTKELVRQRMPVDDRLRFARTCYNHLAGTLAVQINDAFEERGFLAPVGDKRYRVTNLGHDWFNELGVDIAELRASRSGFARQCLDWTERRRHLAGPLGTALLQRFLALKWLVRIERTRAVRVTAKGQERLHKLLGIEFTR